MATSRYPDRDSGPPGHELLARRRAALRRHKKVSLAWAGAAIAIVLGVATGLAVLLSSMVLLPTSALATAAAGMVAQAAGTLPAPHQFPVDSLVYDRGGQLLADIHVPGTSRLPVALKDVSPALVRATVDVEDRNFWTEGAIDPVRLVAAAWHDVRYGSSLQGASTITQQLAKVTYLSDSPTIARKLRELFVASHLERSLSKNQILQAYLNNIPYGHGAVGIEAAAQTYFSATAALLAVAAAALLAGLPDAPSQLDPIRYPTDAKQRQQLVLDAMVRAGDITSEQAATAFAEPLHFASGAADNINLQPAFVARALQQATAGTKVNPATAGLTVMTTLDSHLQSLAQQTVTDQVRGLANLQVTDGALVSMDPTTGNVLAYVGGAGPGAPGSQIDMAAVPRQPGSSFKLFTYSTAIQERKVTMLTPVYDGPFSLPTGGGPSGNQPWTVHDYDLRYHGVLPVEMALGNSLNIPAVKIELLTGIPNIVETARAMGVTTLTQRDSSYSPSLTLGAYPVPLWEMAQAATAFASGGELHPARFVSSVKDAAGHELLKLAAPRQVLDAGTVFIMNQMLGDDSNRTMEFGAHSALTLPNHIVSAKTGTTNDFKDNLTIGWTPRLVTATWVGNADDHPMHGTT
ncbi:MAG: transglycosylase domain-containing protein, partial [Chloroflexota bacterium]